MAKEISDRLENVSMRQNTDRDRPRGYSGELRHLAGAKTRRGGIRRITPFCPHQDLHTPDGCQVLAMGGEQSLHSNPAEAVRAEGLGRLDAL